MPLGKPKIFIVFGMPRAATTFLYYTLGKHPSVFVPYRKESHYFSVNYDKGQDWFCDLYQGQGASEIGADINPVYYLDDKSIARVLDYDPDVRVVLGVREPVEFAVSLYTNMVMQGHPVGSIEEMVSGYDWALSPQASVKFCLADSYMRRKVDELCSTFADNLLIYDFRVFETSPLIVLNEIEAFLGLPEFFNESNYENVRINAAVRRSNRFVNSIITNQRVLDMMYMLAPRGLVRRARSAFERLSVSDGNGTRREDLVSEASLANLRQLLSIDREYYQNLFLQHGTLRGSDVAACGDSVPSNS